MPKVVATFNDFSGGHWGNVGGIGSKPSQWGGINILPTRQGTLAPASSSRPFVLDDLMTGRIWGSFWAWGFDGRFYFIQEGDVGPPQVYNICAFTPDPTTAQAISTIGSFSDTGHTIIYEIDWTMQAENLFATVWGTHTEKVSYTPIAGPWALTQLTGSEGYAPGGRCIAFYGERLLVGGVNDTLGANRFGNHRNRIVFSGNLEGGFPGDFTFWPDLQYFDVGPDPFTFVAGMYPIRDMLVIVMSNQEVWVLTGVPGVNDRLRRVYGFHHGSGGIRVFAPDHATVDPSQSRVWIFDHGTRGPARFNGATYSRLTQYGSPIGLRTGDDTAGTDGVVFRGATASFGGPDEFVMDGIAMPRTQRPNSVHGELVRLNQTFGLVESRVLTGG